MSNFTFTDRETYKEFVQNWKATYKANSQAIRDTKREIKERQKAGQAASALQSRREYLRTIQRNALKQRADAKVKAQRQYEAEKALRDAA